jgi:adenylate cyclase
MSGDPAQEFFADGISEDIIAELSRSRSLFVIARNSSFTYKGRAVDVRQVARELCVRYVLEGSVRQSSGRARIVAQLIEAETGNHIWAERYDRAVEDVFAVQDEITSAVVTTIVPAVADAELRRVLRKPPENLGAWEAYQRGLWHASKATAVDNERALDFFRLSAKLDPTFASPHAMLAYYYGWGFASGNVQPVHEILHTAEVEARCAIALDPDDATAHAVLSWAHLCEGDPAAALERAEYAISVAPSDAVAWLAKGRVLVFSGKPGESRSATQTALRLSPRGPVSWIAQLTLTISHYLERDYIATLDTARRTIHAHPDFALPYRWLAAALGRRTHAAREALQQAIDISPVNGRPPWLQREDHEHMLDGLRKAGWQG